MSEDKTSVLNECIEDIRKKLPRYDGLVIYGAGKMGQLVCDFLVNAGLSINAFCVTAIENHAKTIKNLPVKNVEYFFSAEQKKKYLFLIAIRPPANNDMKNHLIKCGGGGVLNDIIDLSGIASALDENYLRPMIEITPKIGCKIRCRYCPQDLLIKKYFNNSPEATMDFDTFKRCIDKTPKNCIVQFMGFVEPFLCENIIDMMEYANEQGHPLTLSTTLVGLTVGQFKRVEKIPFELVILHLPDKNNYADIHITDEYLQTLDYVLEAKRENGKSFVDVCNAQCEPHTIIIEHLKGRFPVSCNMNNRAGNVKAEELQDNTKSGTLTCVLSPLINHNVLLPNGDVVLCCMDFGLKHILGNLLNNTYEEIMTGEEITRIREAMKQTDSDILCRQCAYSY